MGNTTDIDISFDQTNVEFDVDIEYKTPDPTYYTKAETDALLAKKADNTAVEALSAQVEVNTGAIAGKASASEVSALAGRVTSAESALSGKIDQPASGSAGQFLMLTADGTAWNSIEIPAITLAACSGLGLSRTGSGPAFSWTDPDNVILNGATLAAWNRTVLVRKVGSYPADRQDGTVMAETSAALGNKNYYRDHSYTDETQEPGSTYYYKLFSATTVGDWNDLTANEYTDGTGLSWSQVRQYVRDGRGAELFPVGTVFVVDHAEYSHTNGDGLYFRVVGHDQVPAQDENIQHTMCLEMTDCLFNAPYDAAELEYALTWDTTAQAGKTYYTQSEGSWVQLVLGTDYDIGDPVPAAEWYEKNLDGRNNGSNNAAESNMIQWANSTGAANQWFTPQTLWDVCSSGLLNKNGFMRHLDPLFAAVIQPAKLTTAKCNAEGGGSITHSAKFWPLSVTQVFGSANNDVTENTRLKYYADGGSAIKYAKDTEKATEWWLRSPSSNHTNRVSCVQASGASTSHYASPAYGFSLACIIA